ncbi:MAG: NAD(+)/NADH kinase [Rhodothermales bacterium]|nr:NAD(+)/NADH kinase [Rhodothermales bacterium]MBO6779769.1 NAD(+)/NADH kinase [Rhodothermales bacterium]
MVFGITGNTSKGLIWEPIARLVRYLKETDRYYRIHDDIARGLVERDLIEVDDANVAGAAPLASACTVVLSFGGDGTLLNTAHEIGNRETPVLGVNLGRLGFLASLEEGDLEPAIHNLEAGNYKVEKRMVLEAHCDGLELPFQWALNEFVIQRPGDRSLLAIDVKVDDTRLNTYWSDGLIMATPTGSTAYNLAAGGPIVVPTSQTIIMTPLAAHTLTVRPVVLPGGVTIEASVLDGEPFVFMSDGRSTMIEDGRVHLSIRRAKHTVNLIQMPEHHFFRTLRTKLMWGARKG